MVYWGPAKHSTSYFKEIGHPIPEFNNPADFFMEILHIGSETTTNNEAIVDELITKYKKSTLKSEMEESHPVKSSKISSRKDATAGFLFSGMLIAKRNIVDIFRSPLKIRASMFQTIFLALLIGLIYLQQSFDVSSIQNRTGALFFIATNQMMSAIVSLVNTFPADKVVFF